LRWISVTIGSALSLISWFALPCAPQSSAAPALTKGSTELQLWVSGSKDVSIPNSFVPGVPGINGWGVGARYGRVLSDLHGPGFLRGRAEYAGDVEPVMVFYQHGRPIYAFGASPLGMQWNFRERRGFTPFGGVAGGMLFADHSLPAGTQALNFTANGGVGVRWNRRRGSPLLAVDLFHISNASLGPSNPSINLVRFRLAFDLFTRQK
jgi:hypothetical protein